MPQSSPLPRLPLPRLPLLLSNQAVTHTRQTAAPASTNPGAGVDCLTFAPKTCFYTMNQYILVADSGSTKTDWILDGQDGTRLEIHTNGINPVRDARDIIYNVISQQLLPELPSGIAIPSVYFYGAGCIAPFSENVQSVLAELMPGSAIEVESDLLGAARALCGNEPGIACILGTGANSCYFDGQHIAQNTPPLGFILGDEGSGAYLGKILVAGIFKGLLPLQLKEAFCQKFNMQMSDVIQRVYRQPAANAFLASLVPFIAEHRQQPQVHDMLIEAFRQFIRRNIIAYQHPELPIHLVGGIAFQFEAELREAVAAENMEIGQIVRRPIDRMVVFHHSKH